jgi:alpha-tubulin suppressor-like RCC1 family protein
MKYFEESPIRLMQAGYYHTLFVTEDRWIRAVGYNGFASSLGIKRNGNQMVPTKLDMDDFEFGMDTFVIQMSCGKWHRYISTIVTMV